MHRCAHKNHTCEAHLQLTDTKTSINSRLQTKLHAITRTSTRAKERHLTTIMKHVRAVTCLEKNKLVNTYGKNRPL